MINDIEQYKQNNYFMFLASIKFWFHEKLDICQIVDDIIKINKILVKLINECQKIIRKNRKITSSDGQK